ncbi:MAG: ABC transporter substrate-binding protein [Oscillospiraceae bacterium]|jgi:peptide/nickel transport system substrate-binding protein
MKKLSRLLVLFLAIAMLFALAACGSGNAGKNKSDKSVTVGIASNYYYFNPMGGSESDAIANGMLYNTLFQIDQNGKYYSPVSDDWGWEDDTTLRITIKDGIYFSDGSKMTANDVLATMRFAQECGSQRAGLWNGVIDFDSTYVTDDGMTIYIKYYDVYGAALSEMCIELLSGDFVSSHPDGDDVWWKGPVGSGPYKVKELVNGSYITYELRDDYWDKSKNYECKELTVRYYSDSTTMWVDYQNGVIDVALDLNDEQVKALESGQVKGTLVKKNTHNVPCLVMYEDNQYLSDINVRKAMSYALDFAAVGDMAWGSLQSPATSHFADTLGCYTNYSGYFTYDPEEAKRILKEAGYDEGEITLSYVAVNVADEVAVMEAIQGYLSAVGINVECSSLDLNSALQYYFGGGNDLALLTTRGANYQREPRLNATINGIFVDRMMTHPEYVALLKEGLATHDYDSRMEAYKKVDKWLFENYWLFPIAQPQEALCFNERIKSININNIGFECLGDITFN